MMLLEVYAKDGVPDHYRFVFDDKDDSDLNAVLAMTKDGRQAVWVREQYQPEGSNEHLGRPIPLASLGEIALNGFFSWLAIPTQYGRDDQVQIIKDDDRSVK